MINARKSKTVRQSTTPSDVHVTDVRGLSFYSEPPDVEVSVREFEEYTRDRLKVLHAFDRLCSYDTHLGSIPELKPRITKELVDSRLDLVSPYGSDRESFAAAKSDFIKRD